MRLIDSDKQRKKERRFRSMSPSRFLEANWRPSFLTPLTSSNHAGQLTGNSGVNHQAQAQALAQAPYNPLEESEPGRGRIDGVLDAVAQLYYRRKDVDSVGAGDAWSSREYDTYSYPTLHLLLTPLRQPHPLDYWTPLEMILFEAGMLSIGKDFHQLRKLIRTKTTNEVVDFYYAWKKSSHYAIWKNFERVQRKFYPAKFEQWERLDTLMEGFTGTVHKLPPVTEPPAETAADTPEEKDGKETGKAGGNSNADPASDKSYAASLGLGRTRRSRASLRRQQEEELQRQEEEEDEGGAGGADSGESGEEDEEEANNESKTRNTDETNTGPSTKRVKIGNDD